jgi:radical SAM-linked protein
MSSAPLRFCAVVRYAKRGPVRFVGHLDLARSFDRAVRRAGLPVCYSEGFNPRARISFAAPLPVGVQGEAEWCVIDLERPLAPAEVQARLEPQMPPGIHLWGVEVRPRGKRSPTADVTQAEYQAVLGLGAPAPEMLRAAAAELLAAEELPVERETKRLQGVQDIRPGLLNLEITQNEPPVVAMRVRIAEGQTAKPDEVLRLLARQLGLPGDLPVDRLVRTVLL